MLTIQHKAFVPGFLSLSLISIVLVLNSTLALSEKVSPEICLLCEFNFKKSFSTIVLPKKLREASGLSMNDEKQVLIHNDERAKVWAFEPLTGTKVKSFSFPENLKPLKGDFEGIASSNSTHYLITSNGLIYVLDQQNKIEIFDTGLGSSYEIEGLTYYPPNNSLKIALKTIYDKHDPRGLVLFEWSVESSKLTSNTISIPRTKLKSHTGKDRFRASGITYDEKSKHFILVSRVNEMLLEITDNGSFVTGFKINRKYHKQPEGLAIFSQDGAKYLIIVDEGSKATKATLTIYIQE